MAVDRRHGPEVAMETAKLAEEFLLSSDGMVVGLDLSGDPTVRTYYHTRKKVFALDVASGCTVSIFDL